MTLRVAAACPGRRDVFPAGTRRGGRGRLAAAVLTVLASGLAAQDLSAPPRLVFSGSLDLVYVTATVQDERGHLVSNLQREDFTVFGDGRPQSVQVFARTMEPGEDESLGLDLGLLLDTSQSMLAKLKLSQQAAVRFLEAIPRARDLVTVFFDQDIRISRYDSEDQQGLVERIQAAKGGGNTALYDAIAVYLSRIQNGAGRKVLVLFTDGEDSVSTTRLGEVLDLVRSSPVTVYSIGFSSGLPIGSLRALKSRAFLARLADLTGGRVFEPSGSQDLGGIYDTILDELANQYVLGILPDSPTPNGKFHPLRVQARRPGLRVRHRSGYYTEPRSEP